MEFRDRTIITQVAFKATVDLMSDIDIVDPAGQAKFEEAFSYLTASLVQAVELGTQEGVGNLIRGAFPGTVQVSGGNTGGYVPQDPSPTPPQYQPQPQFVQPVQTQPQGGGVQIKGTQFGPIPDWLFEEAAAKGVTEVYDNRDRATGTKRPWFRATSGGDNAQAFWPPR